MFSQMEQEASKSRKATETSDNEVMSHNVERGNRKHFSCAVFSREEKLQFLDKSSVIVKQGKVTEESGTD